MDHVDPAIERLITDSQLPYIRAQVVREAELRDRIRALEHAAERERKRRRFWQRTALLLIGAVYMLIVLLGKATS